MFRSGGQRVRPVARCLLFRYLLFARLIRYRWLWLAGALLIVWGLIFAADRLWPLPLKEVNPARVVVDEKGTPLWRFADSEGIWRYPVTIEEVSPRYLDALIQYKERWN